MAYDVKIIGGDGEQIRDLNGWLEHAPPEGGEAQWVDGYSAKEQAKTWLRGRTAGAPAEVAYSLASAGVGPVDRWTAFPEHRTQLDDYGRPRQHDLLLLLGDPSHPDVVVGIEAKACESYDGTVAQKVATAPPSNLPARCNQMAHALFGRPVCDETNRTVVDHRLGRHGYQLWTAAVGSLREAQARGCPRAVMLVHQFAPGPGGPPPGDSRPWARKLYENATMFADFQSALGGPRATAHPTRHVSAGTALYTLAVCSLIDAAV